MVTEDMITERTKLNQREYMRKYRAEHREQINAYQRSWNKQYRETTGQSYSTLMARKKAERELRAEMEG